MKPVFVDSSGFFAHLAAADPFHERSTSLFQQAKAERWQLVSTNAVVFETYALLLYRTRNGRTNALAFLDSVERGFCIKEYNHTAITILPKCAALSMSFKASRAWLNGKTRSITGLVLWIVIARFMSSNISREPT